MAKVVTDDLLGKNPSHECVPRSGVGPSALRRHQLPGKRTVWGVWALGGGCSHPACLPSMVFIGKVAHSGSASTLLGHLLPREGAVYRDSYCHLRGHPRGFDGDPQTPVLEGQQCAPWPRWTPARSQNSGKEGGRVSVQSGTLAGFYF